MTIVTTAPLHASHPQLFRPAGLLLTAAIGAAPGTIDAAYDVERMYEYLDYVHGEGMTAS